MLDVFMSEDLLPNEKLSEELRSKLSELEAFRRSIVINRAGYLTVFVRDGQIGKITFQRNSLNSFEVSKCIDDNVSNRKMELSPRDYRIFSYLIATSITYIDEVSYGTLRFQFTIEEDNGEFKYLYSLTFDEEIHYKIERNNNKVKARY